MIRSMFCAKLTLAVGCLSIFAANAAAQVFVNDNFDGYADQTAFEAVWAPIGTAAPISATLSTVQAVSAPNSIEILGTAVNAQQRNQRTFAETGGASNLNLIVFSFDFFDSNAAAAPYRQFSTLQDSTAPTGTNQLIGLGMNNNQTGANSGGNFYMARILGYDPIAAPDPDGGPAESVGGAGAYFKLNDFNAGLRTTGFHNLRVEISTDDGLSTDYAFFVDGVLAERVNNVGTAASIRSYDVIRLGSGLSNGNNTVYYDNMFVEVQIIPEPTSLTLAGLGLAGVWLRKRRRTAA